MAEIIKKITELKRCLKTAEGEFYPQYLTSRIKNYEKQLKEAR